MAKEKSVQKTIQKTNNNTNNNAKPVQKSETIVAKKIVDIKEFDAQKSTWCPGCGNFGIIAAVKKALVNLGISPTDVVLVYGIGCHGHMVSFMNANGFEGLHGRTIPVSVGIKLINPKLKVIAVAGDGDCLGEGGNHFIHSIRGNHDITILVHNNQTYGLTTGQASPTSAHGAKTKSTPFGVIERPFNAMASALASEGTFVARTYAMDLAHMTDVITKAIAHNGTSVVDILQPCPSFNKVNTPEWYKDKLYKVESQKDRNEAFKKAMEEEKIPIGIIYQEESESYTDQLPQLKNGSIVQTTPSKAISKLMKGFC